AIFTRFAEAGASVVIANRSLDVAEALAAELSARGLSVRAVALAGLDRTTLHALVGDVVRKSGRLDIVVHNAGGCPWASVEELDEEKLEEALAVNLKACFWLAQAVAPAMRANGFGRILVTSSVSAHVAMAGGAHYSAAN
ncbi:SDR family NAD(P)-dependent oxidoreductase, partial [Mesorhizobium sp. M5C.F.Ca.ET.164.01.1.1]|uniref:SDR family NAD(P)-dependent oxidoreductase n=1 Tax=Mesorhizobium sp. M5C.F.Ca.ET.164.01.1.1 TaxID=2563957 RepID=UPI0010935A6E